MSTELNHLSLFEVAEAIQSGKASAVEVATTCIERIQQREPVVKAFESFDADKVLENARKIDQGEAKGILAGVPIGIKDIIDVKGDTSRWGSPIYQNRKPHWDASCVALCREAGANIFGKTVTTEFAYFYPGKTVNPHNPEHTPGGSSMGSAAAVADHMLPFAFGTQTAASVIRPAAYCGVIGYKASYGSFDLQGVCGLAASLDTLGFICRDLRDIPLMRSVLCGDTARLEQREDEKPPRIGLVKTPYWDMADEDTQALIMNTSDRLEKSRAVIEAVTLSSEFDQLAEYHNQIMAFEVARSRAFEYLDHRSQLSAQFIDLVETGQGIDYQQYRQSKEATEKAKVRLKALSNEYDILLAPSATGEAPKGLDATGNPIFSRMWTLLHVPSITIPAGRGSNNLPLGIQLIGAFNEDHKLVRDTDWVQRALF